MYQKIENSLAEAVQAVQMVQTREAMAFIAGGARALADCFSEGNKVLLAGNGGSLCDAIHFAEELVGQFRGRRRALPALALSDPGVMSCVGNDFGFEAIFSRGVEAFGREGDLFIALTTSGNSPNIIQALMVAKEKGLKTMSFLGKTGGKMKGLSDYELVIPGFAFSDRIQEAHMVAIHIMIEEMERLLC